MIAIAKLIFHTLKHTFTFAKRAFIVVVVFSAIFILFGYVIAKDRPKINPDKILAYQRQKIDAQLAALPQNDDVGNAQATLYKGWLCSSVGEACEGGAITQTNFQNSLFGKMSGLIASPYANPPSSGIAWTYNSLQDAGFVPNTYAATGIGFASIQGYMEIWKLFRNIAYLILVVIMLVIGIMIMFRRNGGGQTAVTIESALPRITIALLMITFSFPIAGFLIDLMYAAIALSIGLLFDVGSIISDAGQIDGRFNFTSSNMALGHFMNASFTDLWPGSGRTTSLVGTGIALYKLVPSFIQNLLQIVVIPGAIVYANTLLLPAKGILEAFTNVIVAGFGTGNLPLLLRVPLMLSLIIGLVTWLPGLIIALILLLTVLLFMFRIFFMLISSYIKILLYIIFAPIILLFSALPGNGNIGWWIRNLIGELLPFPTIIVIFLVANAITSVAVNNAEFAGLSLLGRSLGLEQGFRLPFLYGFQAEEFNTIISLGLVLMIPEFIKMVKGFAGVQESPINFGIGTYFAGAGIFGAGMGAASSIQNLRHTMVGVNYQKPQGLLHAVGLGGWADKMSGHVPKVTP